MKGEIGDFVIFVDKHGDEHDGVIQDETINDNATIMFFEDNNFEAKSIRFCFNTECESESVKDRRVYRLVENQHESEMAEKMGGVSI